MREIKFRGKDVETGELRIGIPLIFNDGSIFMQVNCGLNHRKEEYFSSIAVTPGTVGQFTGLTDKKGNDIYEGDILKINGALKSYFIGYVKFLISTGMFVVANDSFFNKKFYEFTSSAYSEIIGNIYDNPEYLEGK